MANSTKLKKEYKVQDHPDHFLVDDGAGKPFKIAKAAIPEHLHGHIQGLAQQTKKMAKGGEAEGSTAYKYRKEHPEEEQKEVASPLKLGYADPEIEAAVQRSQELGARGEGLTQKFPSPGAPPSAEQMGVTAESMIPDVAQRVAARAAAVTPAPAPRIGAPPADQKEGGPSGLLSTKPGEAALEAKAGVESRRMAAIAVRKHDSMEAEAAYNQSEDAKEAANKEQLAKARKDYAEGRINENQYWENSSFVGKAGALIGLIMSGIGSGITGQPNLAYQTIQRAIDRNIESQIRNRDAKGNLITQLQKEGYDMREARMRAEVRMKDQLASQIDVINTDFAPQEAKANLLAAKAALQQDVTMKNATLRSEGLNAARQAVELKHMTRQIQQEDIDRVGQRQMVLTGKMDPAIAAQVSPGVLQAFRPSSEEVAARSALNTAGIGGEINPILARIPFGAEHTKARGRAENIAEKFMNMEGVQPSQRSLLAPQYIKMAEDLDIGTPAMKEAAQAFFMNKLAQHREAQTMGIPGKGKK